MALHPKMDIEHLGDSSLSDSFRFRNRSIVIVFGNPALSHDA